MMPHNTFIVGANGQLGSALREIYPDARTADISELDITSQESIENYDWSNVEVIINAAAYTNVDGAETPEGRIAAWKVNASAVGNLARKAAELNITLVHVSSEYVFDGTTKQHGEEEPFSPLGVYAQSKAAGDIAVGVAGKHYIARTTWLIGNGNNFVKTMASLADKGVQPSVVNDQIGRLTFTSTLAAGIKHLIDTGAPYGTYNITNDGDVASWSDIAKLVYESRGRAGDDVTPVSTSQYYAGKSDIAPRPLQSGVDLRKIKATGFTPSDWRTELSAYLNNL